MAWATRHPGDPYETPPPWDIGHPQPALRALADQGAITGRLLDVGCGTGEHVLLAATLGLPATGVDLAASALRIAEGKARDRGLAARFRQHDACRLAELGEQFDTVLDCGLFHLFDPAERPAFVASLASALRPGGRYFMLGFSDQQPGEGGPRRLSRADITTAFANGWRVDSLEPATIEITPEPGIVAAWLANLTRE